MLDALPRTAFSALASSSVLKRLASRYGMRRTDSFARRFIAGETTEEAIEIGPGDRTQRPPGHHRLPG